MKTKYVRFFIKDTLTPRIDHKISIYPKNVYPYFVHPSLEIIKRKTTPYVPRNTDPPTDGKMVAGTLQKGFYASNVSSDLYESNVRFGYSAYDPVKMEYYAEDQYVNESYNHQPRYAGHKPRAKFLKYGINDSNDEVMADLSKKYIRFLKSM